ncbi:hypothetical protein [Peptostreptococcus faecalis]|uniref:hypothetical protein n=1 Tax=Peptostreptococcus faecalis TaxID=2045015 RepID=UPI000C7D31F5|nr:hypothetical protein [Peptostreptococcus faecalis]
MSREIIIHKNMTCYYEVDEDDYGELDSEGLYLLGKTISKELTELDFDEIEYEIEVPNECDEWEMRDI